MKDIIVISAPISIQVHLGNPKMARIPELAIRAMAECEGGGWYMPTGQAEALVEAWNGFVNSPDEDGKYLPTWAQLTAYWKSRCEKAEAGISGVPDLLAVLNALVEEMVEYAAINKLGDAEKQHNIKWARAVIAKATA